MKKLSLTGVALLCFAALTHAQINQVGASQFAEQNRTGPTQIGDISQVEGQDGTNFGNYAITFQSGSAEGNPNEAYIRQNNGSQGNRAGITQTGGPGNFANIDQNGGSYGLAGGSSSMSATIGRAGELGNFAGIAQLGANNSAVISQRNLTQLNGSEIYQNGTDNKALVDQADNSIGNRGFVFQGYTGQNQLGSAVNNAVATINQSGPNPKFDRVGESVGNLATVTQTVSNVQALISQGSREVRDAYNFVQSPFPGAVGRAVGSVASIDQLNQATDSYGTIIQGGEQGRSLTSSAAIVQTNRYNSATIFQGTGGGNDQGSIARITQEGAGYVASGIIWNNVFVDQGTQGGTSYLNQAIVTQTSSAGENSRAQVSQGSGNGAMATRNQALIIQSSALSTGSSYASVDIIQGVGPGSAQDNQASIVQSSQAINGSLVIDQGANFETSRVSTKVPGVEASRNVASITQLGGINSQARIGQGTNMATYANREPPVPQSSARSLSGTAFGLGTIARDNRADITQVQGNGNYALLLQSGEQNIARIIQQTQDNNFATIVQTQNANRAIATINQLDGSANQATIQQFGSADGNVSIGTADQAIINQFRGSNNIAFLQQGAPGVSGSGGNYAIVTQNGNANQARFLQQGVGNFVSITQNGDGNQLLNSAGTAGSYGSQVGNNNSLRLIQSGGRTFSYTQVGNNNTQVVSQ